MNLKGHQSSETVEENTQEIAVETIKQITTKRVGKNTNFQISTSGIQDSLPGISVNLIENEKCITAVDVDCDIVERKVIISIWEKEDDNAQEIIINI